MCFAAPAAKIHGAFVIILSDLKLGRSKLPRRYPRDFTFYVADPISSILQITFDAEQSDIAAVRLRRKSIENLQLMPSKGIWMRPVAGIHGQKDFASIQLYCRELSNT